MQTTKAYLYAPHNRPHPDIQANVTGRMPAKALLPILQSWLAIAVLTALMPTAFGSELLVANYSGNRQNIEVFRSTDSGNASPIRSISGRQALMDWPWAVAADAQRLYVANYTMNETNQVTIYHLADSGSNVTPAVTLSCPFITLARAIAVDNESIVVCSATAGISTFPLNADGAVLPRYRIHGAEYSLDNLGGMAMDANHIYAGISAETGAIHVFRRTDDGTVAPQRTLRSAACNLRNIGAMTVDAHCLYVLNDPGTTTNQCILVFDKTAGGETLPLRRIKGANTRLSDSRGIAVDGQYIYVTSHDRTSILAFPILSDGNVPPHHILSPEYPNPSLYAPYGIAARPDTPSRDTPTPGPRITADGIHGAITVPYPTPFTIAISAVAGDYAGIPVDWFLVAVPDNGATWYYLKTDGTWGDCPANATEACQAALQAPLSDITQPLAVLETALTPGTYTFYFIIDYPMDGKLNLAQDAYLADAIRINVQP